MPDKSKRRKNNKNKRNKHKNKHDSNKISNVETSNTESCDASVDGDQEECGVNKEIEDYSTLSLSSDSLIKKEDIPDKDSDSVQKTNQDLNCNSADLPDLNTTVINNKMCDEVVIDSIVNNLQCTEPYVVESPEPLVKAKTKLNSNIKSKSLDNDDTTKIVEITDECSIQSDEENSSTVVNVNNALVSDVDSDIEWEKTGEFKNPQTNMQDFIAEPSTTCDIPIRITHNDASRTPLTPEEEEYLRNCLQKLPLTSPSSDSSEIIIQTVQVVNHGVKHRLRKKASADDFIFQRLGPPRTLDVIDEEGSGESSKSSRRQSYLSEKKNDVEDLDDEVFESVVKKEKYVTKMNKNAFGKQIQQQCLLVDAKIKDPEITEARGDWSVTNTEKMFGAEVVYLTDTSSSTSSIYDNSEECDEGEETDVSVRMITPTIEVTDTETLLKETFVPNNEAIDKKIETPVNELPNHVIQHPEELNAPSSHEIVVLSTDNIQTNLTVKDVLCENENTKSNSDDSNPETCENGEPPIVQRTGNEYDLEMKVLKCELNDAINNLIKEVSSDSETSDKNSKEALNRQDSSSSVGSSQCTAKYNPTYSSLNDVANIVHDDMCDDSTNTQNTSQLNNTSHVKEVFECVTGTTTLPKNEAKNEPSSLKDLCVKKVATFPYGDKILEELASVSKQLQNITVFGHHSNSQEKVNERYLGKEKLPQQAENMPCYPLPDVSSIEKVSLPTKENKHVPPPIKPRNSSLKISQDENHWVGLPTETEPVYVCFSPSQKMLMEKTNTVITKQDASQLVDMHKKYVDRRGYNENNDKEQRKENQRADKTPVIPFKSQTGSRLLALIRDPTVTDNITSKKTRNQLQIIDEVQHLDKTLHKKYNNTQFSSVQEFPSNFRPIPPPRTRKFSSSVYESDESSDFTDSSFRSMKNERKIFHYSTGNLSKEIENDISSIQNMHRYYTDVRDNLKDEKSPRRPSLPKDLCDQQMEYIRRKEKEVEAEIHRLENEKLYIPDQQTQRSRAPLYSESKMFDERITRTSHHSMLLQKDSSLKTSASKLPKVPEDKGKLSVFSRSQEELLRDKMYSEYVSQMAEREERRQQKVIKITNNTNSKPFSIPDDISKSMPSLDFLDSKVNNRIEKEFIWKARQRWNKLGIKDPETEDEREDTNKNVYKEPKVIEHKIKVIEGGEERDVKKLPSHLQEFVRFTVKDSDKGKSSPGESSTGPASPHVIVLCAVIILVLAVGKFFLRMLRNK